MHMFARLLFEDRCDAAQRLTALLARYTTLTPREAELVAYDYCGYSRAEVAKALGIQVTSVKVYWRRVYKKLLPSSRAALHGWVDYVITCLAHFQVRVDQQPACAPLLSARIAGGSIAADGRVLDHNAYPTGFRLGPDRTQLVDDYGTIVGIVTATGVVYDLEGIRVAQVQRHTAQLSDSTI